MERVEGWRVYRVIEHAVSRSPLDDITEVLRRCLAFRAPYFWACLSGDDCPDQILNLPFAVVASRLQNVAVVPRSNASLTLPTYLHWKPVSYRDGRRTVTLSVDAKNQNLTSGAGWWRFNAATAWMAHRAPNVSSTALNLTLGSEGDEHYKKYRYATW